jgi:hypothetical protein
MSLNTSLRIVVYEEDGHFIAQCLEYDICTQAPDKETLRERMDCLIECEMIAMRQAGRPLDPAPEHFHKMLPQGSQYIEVAA